MTPEQRKLARHALGLPNKYRRSYRNRYFAAPGSAAASAWADLVARGAAAREGGDKPNIFFYLTHSGALAALDPGERLDPEDFPEAAQAAS
jgi:hypothetical protein